MIKNNMDDFRGFKKQFGKVIVKLYVRNLKIVVSAEMQGN